MLGTSLWEACHGRKVLLTQFGTIGRSVCFEEHMSPTMSVRMIQVTSMTAPACLLNSLPLMFSAI